MGELGDGAAGVIAVEDLEEAQGACDGGVALWGRAG